MISFCSMYRPFSVSRFINGPPTRKDNCVSCSACAVPGSILVLCPYDELIRIVLAGRITGRALSAMASLPWLHEHKKNGTSISVADNIMIEMLFLRFIDFFLSLMHCFFIYKAGSHMSRLTIPIVRNVSVNRIARLLTSLLAESFRYVR